VAIADTLAGAGEHLIEWRFPLAPGVAAEIRGADVRFALGGRERWLLPASAVPAAWTLEDGWVSPSYGVRHETRVLTLRARLQLPQQLRYLFSTIDVPAAARAAAADSLLSH
jgi:hypothetical protein